MQTTCESDPGALIAPYERARRDAVRLWRAKWQLWKAGQEKFFKTSRELQSINRLCWSDPTCQIRALADASACRFADIHGDAPFHKTVDGAELLSPTMWFYGTLPVSSLDRDWNRTKQFKVSELLLLWDLQSAAKAFTRSVAALPNVDVKRLSAESKKWSARLERATDLIVGCSPECQGFLWLIHDRKMPYSVAREIAAFWDG